MGAWSLFLPAVISYCLTIIINDPTLFVKARPMPLSEWRWSLHRWGTVPGNGLPVWSLFPWPWRTSPLVKKGIAVDTRDATPNSHPRNQDWIGRETESWAVPSPGSCPGRLNPHWSYKPVCFALQIKLPKTEPKTSAPPNNAM